MRHASHLFVISWIDLSEYVAYIMTYALRFILPTQVCYQFAEG